uniref:Uncharacterized protein n=1 Tax=Firmicutes phage HS18 TaxID=3056396 RepID=A0AA50ADL0_9VIRU|nr:MAG: hypothetical protein [Firmicutes phage HS18]
MLLTILWITYPFFFTSFHFCERSFFVPLSLSLL